jgi:hypothetical protein
MLCFFIHKKKHFRMHFGFNNQFIKVKRTLAKISKKKLFCLSFSIRGMTLYVIRIHDIRLVRFYPIKIRISLLRRVFLDPLDRPTIRNHNKTLDFIRQQNNAAYLR